MKTTSNKYSFTDRAALNAYAKFKAANWIKFAFKYFSKSTEKENMKPSNVITTILLSLFAVGFIATVMNLPKVIIMWATLGYFSILTILVIFLFAAAFANNRRIKKITNELGCTLEEWNRYINENNDKIK